MKPQPEIRVFTAEAELNPRLWIRKEAAAKLLETTPRQIERYAERNLIRKQMVKGASGGVVALLSVEDLETLKRRRAEGPVRDPNPIQSAIVLPKALEEAPKTAPDADTKEPEDYVAEPARPRAWLTIAEAERWSGLPPHWIRRAAETGRISAINVGGGPKHVIWRVFRDSLTADLSRLFPVG